MIAEPIEISDFKPSKGINSQFHGVGDNNLVDSHPIIEIGEKRYFIPILFLLNEAIYNSPFYWMFQDPSYSATAAKNREAAARPRGLSRRHPDTPSGGVEARRSAGGR
jgi:hypothetical protein